MAILLVVPHPVTDQQRKILKKMGAKLRSIRLEKGLTLKAAGHAVGKDSQSIQRLESGKINPSLLYLLEVCKGLEIQISQIINDLDSESLSND